MGSHWNSNMKLILIWTIKPITIRCILNRYIMTLSIITNIFTANQESIMSLLSANHCHLIKSTTKT